MCCKFWLLLVIYTYLKESTYGEETSTDENIDLHRPAIFRRLYLRRLGSSDSNFFGLRRANGKNKKYFNSKEGSVICKPSVSNDTDYDDDDRGHLIKCGKGRKTTLLCWACSCKKRTPYSCLPADDCACASNSRYEEIEVVDEAPTPFYKLPINKQKKSSKSKKKECTPGEMVQVDGCNQCVCDKSGHVSVCTLMFCPEEAGTFGPPVDNPNVTFVRRSANLDKLTADGMVFFQPADENPLPTRRQRMMGLKCPKKQKKATFCYWCTCNDDGDPDVCVPLKDCSHKSPKVLEHYISHGNVMGDKHSGFYTISKKAAKKIAKQHKCEPGKTISPDGCNDCVCGDKKTPVLCTKRVCEDDEDRYYDADYYE